MAAARQDTDRTLRGTFLLASLLLAHGNPLRSQGPELPSTRVQLRQQPASLRTLPRQATETDLGEKNVHPLSKQRTDSGKPIFPFITPGTLIYHKVNVLPAPREGSWYLSGVYCVLIGVWEIESLDGGAQYSRSTHFHGRRRRSDGSRL